MPFHYCSPAYRNDLHSRHVGRASARTTRGEPSQVSETGPGEGHISRILEISQLLANTATSEMGFWRACGRFQSASRSVGRIAGRPIKFGRRLKPAPHGFVKLKLYSAT